MHVLDDTDKPPNSQRCAEGGPQPGEQRVQVGIEPASGSAVLDDSERLGIEVGLDNAPARVT